MKAFIVLSIFFYVYHVVGITSFFEKGQRAELFELMDNKVSTLKITIPDDEFELFKIKANKNRKDNSSSSYNHYYSGSKSNNNNNNNDDTSSDNNNNNNNNSEYVENFLIPNLESLKPEVQSYLELLKLYNLVELYPDFPVNEFPELEITLNGFSFDKEDYHYVLTIDELKLYAFRSNKKFRLLDILITLANMSTYTNTALDDVLVNSLSYYKFAIINDDDDYSYDRNEADAFYEQYYSELPEEVKETYNREMDDHKQRLLTNLDEIHKNLKRRIQLLKKYNFRSLYPDFDFDKNLPELGINGEGYSDIDVNTILAGFKTKFEDYDQGGVVELGYHYHDLNLRVYQSNENFDVLKILTTLAQITTFTDYYHDNEYTRRLVYFKFVSRNDANSYTLDYDNYLAYSLNYFDREDSDSFDDNTNDSGYDNYLEDLALFIHNQLYSLNYMLSQFKEINFREDYPTIDFAKELPELDINQFGYAEIDIKTIVKEFYIDITDCDDNNYQVNKNDVMFTLYQSNPEFNAVKVLNKLATYTHFTNYNEDKIYINMLSQFKYCIEGGDGFYTLDKESFNEFDYFYKKTNITSLSDEETINNVLKEEFDSTFNDIRREIELFKRYNLKKLYPNIDFEEKYPELKINERGYSEINIDETVNGFEYKPEKYLSYIKKGVLGRNYYYTKFISYQNNPNFNLLKILVSLARETNFKNTYADNEFIKNLIVFRFVTITDDDMVNYDEESYRNFIEDYLYDNDIPYLRFEYDNELQRRFVMAVSDIGNLLLDLMKYNLREVFPMIDFDGAFSYLEVDEFGYSQINIDEILSNYEFNSEEFDFVNSIDYDEKSKGLELYVFENCNTVSNAIFQIIRILATKISFEGNWRENSLFDDLVMYQFLYRKSDGHLYLNYDEYGSFLQQFNDDFSNSVGSEDHDFKTKNATMIVEING
ncbi:hypothetical protein PIROE2DRAFT_12437 [Piromyces sp. E2]|nr:hypothetical protein PIROE2DRAFT_12437 [Piromyces sp. E2]|eukprot:OUM61524.1 hypothetical protein PIROE2DRAFT_12437 [Piromyces sp. E2]